MPATLRKCAASNEADCAGECHTSQEAGSTKAEISILTTHGGACHRSMANNCRIEHRVSKLTAFNQQFSPLHTTAWCSLYRAWQY